MNTTEEYWEVDGVSLQTYARNLSTWGGSRNGARRLRGEDIVIPGRAGRMWFPKEPDSYTLTLTGWVLGAANDGTYQGQDEFRENWRALRALLWTPDKQVNLTRRWKDTNGVVRKATARAQFASGLEPTMTGPSRATWSVDLFLADPFFYGDPQEITLAVGETKEVEILGDYRTTKSEIEFVGPLTAGRVAVNTVPQTWLRYLSLPDGSTAVVDVDGWRVVESDGATSTPSIGKIRYDGARGLFDIPPGSRQFSLTATAGTGTAKITYSPAWL